MRISLRRFNSSETLSHPEISLEIIQKLTNAADEWVNLLRRSSSSISRSRSTIDNF
jgi:hypothetical protein